MGNLFFNNLVRSNSQIKSARAKRFSEGAASAAQMAIIALEAERRAVQEAIDAASDISTSNDRQSMNALESFDAKNWFEKLAANKLQLKIINEKLDVHYQIRAEFFEEDAGDVAVTDRETPSE